jgi:CRP-like cAMP-binding protein
VIDRLGPEGVFGELSLIDHGGRSLSAVAVEDCRLAVIDRRHFLFLVHETPTFALDVMRTLATRLRALGHGPAVGGDATGAVTSGGGLA